MDEINHREAYFFEPISPSNINLYQIGSPKKNINKDFRNMWLKYHYKFVLSIIIFIMCITGFLIISKGLFDISKNNQNVDNEFNITDFYISNETCINNKYITNEATNNYYMNIDNFEFSKNLSIILSKISIFISLLLLGNIYYIKWIFEKKQNQNNFFLILSFILCSILFIFELIIFLTILNGFLSLFDILDFLNKNINNKCIIVLSWNYEELVLKHLMKICMVIALLKICHIHLLIYFLKQIILLNNFFYPEEEESKTDELNMSLINMNSK